MAHLVDRLKGSKPNSIKETIGASAGKVWKFPSQNGKASIFELVEQVCRGKNDKHRAIGGWLVRRNKLTVAVRGRFEYNRLA